MEVSLKVCLVLENVLAGRTAQKFVLLNLVYIQGPTHSPVT